MQKNKVWRRIGLFILLVTVMMTIVGCGKKEKPDPLWTVQDFTFTNQAGTSFGSPDLKGKVWLADFIFTNCKTVCPPMTANMKRIQEFLEKRGLDVEIVSFSVDPDVDTPERLKEYAGKFELALSNWNLLTGYTNQEIEKFAYDSFKTLVQKPSDTDQVIHGTYFYLIDQNGNVVRYFDGNQKPPFEDISADIEALMDK